MSSEITFGFEELFFSKTNKAGIIEIGNSVFQRISMYSWDELRGKPHKIIRHPDMPRGVFWLFWDVVKRGEPIAAYVKNQAKDGRYYWVLAIVTPVDQGYLSIRIRPSSEFLAIVKQEYSALHLAEIRDSLTPPVSAQMLLEKIASLGFSDYSSFMAVVISREVSARNAHLGRPRDKMIGFFDDLLEATKSLLGQARIISAAYEKNAVVPLNLQIQAARLGQNGATIGVISKNYTTISTEIKDQLSRFSASAERVFKSVNNALFLVCVASLQREQLAFFEQEENADNISTEQERELLNEQQLSYQKKASMGLETIANEADTFRNDCAEMTRLAAGLEVIRMMAKVECERVAVANAVLSELLFDLETFQRSISAGLKSINQKNKSVQDNTSRLLAVEREGSRIRASGA